MGESDPQSSPDASGASGDGDTPEFDLETIKAFNDIPLNLFGIVTTKVTGGKRVTVFMTRKRTKAYLKIDVLEKKFTITSDEVAEIVTKTKIFLPEWGRDIIDRAVSHLNGTGGESGAEAKLISEGKPKIDGEDSRITWHVDVAKAGHVDESPEESKKGSRAKQIRVAAALKDTQGDQAEDDDAPIDYRAVKELPQVAKGELICSVTPPSEGKSGEDVYGKSIPAKDGSWVLFEPGDGVEVNPERTEYRATDSGFLQLKGKTITVQMVLTVKQVDFNSGNIDYKGRVEVEGDVGEGFSVKAGGELVIGGSGKDVTLQSGRGMVINTLLGEKAIAQSGGSFSASRVNNATVLVDGKATITQELVAARLHVVGAVNATEANMVGGELVSLGPVYLRTVGSPTQTGSQAIVLHPAALKVGPVADLTRQIKEDQATIQKIRTGLGPLAENPKLALQLPEEKRAAILQLLERLHELGGKLNEMKDEHAKAVKKLQHRFTPEVYIKRAYPGTLVRLGDVEKIFNEETHEPIKLSLSSNGKSIDSQPWLAKGEVDLG